MTRMSKASPGQISLLTHGLNGAEFVRDFTSPTPVSEIADPPSVYLVNRAEHLHKALSLLGQISQRTGFQMAAEGSHRPELQDRYHGQVDRVVKGARRNKNDMITGSKGEFSKAFGRMTLARSGLISGSEADELTHDSYQEFVKTFADSHNRPQRDAFRKQLKRNQTKILAERQHNQAS